MPVKIEGTNDLINRLEQEYGRSGMQARVDDALREGAEVFKSYLRSEFDSFADEGHSRDEITLTEPHTRRGARAVTVHWRGPHGRYRVIHLNEYGTVHHPNPAGKGAVARAIRNAESAYRDTIASSLSRRRG